jgi:hypothetical protein
MAQIGYVAAAEVPSEAEATRRRYLSHEASVKSIGLLYYLGAVGSLIGAFGVLLESLSGSALGSGLAPIGAIYLLLGLLLGFLGRGLRRLQRWVRIPVGVLSGIGLLNFPVGTLINGYILYLVFSRKGAMVFSDAYAQVMRQTPHIRYRGSWVLLLILVLVVAAAIAVVISITVTS